MIPLPFVIAGAWDNFATGFGVAAAILTIGGFVFLRFQRNRAELAILRAALDKGITDFPPGPPPWIVSLRQGLMMLALGVALAGVGAGAWMLGEKKLQSLTLSTTQSDGGQTSVLTGPKPRDERGRLTPEGRLASAIRDRWDHARAMETTGQAMTGSGIILIVLGAVRIGFARAERKYYARS